MPLSPRALARVSSRRPWRTIGVWLLALVVAGIVTSRLLGDALTTDVDLLNEPEAKKAQTLLEERLRGVERTTEMVIVSSRSATVDDPAFRAYVERLRTSLTGLGPDVVVGTQTYYESGDQHLVSGDRRTALIPTTLAGPKSEANEHVPALRHVIGEDQAPGFQAAEGLYCGPGRYPGSEAVVHKDHGPPANLGLGTVAPEVAQPAFHLRRLLLRDPLQVVLGDAEPPDDLLVEDAYAPVGDGADAELGLARRPQLARDEDVKRRVEGPRYLVPYGYPSPREGEDHGALLPVRGEPFSQPPAGVLSVSEGRRSVEHPQKPPQRAASSLDHDPGPGRAPPMTSSRAPDISSSKNASSLEVPGSNPTSAV